MPIKRKIEIFSAGCPACKETIAAIQKAACPSCDVVVLDMNTIEVAKRAKTLGIRTVPAVVIEGMVSSCCTGRGVDLDVLRAAGLGQP
jgi:glutaredoxin